MTQQQKHSCPLPVAGCPTIDRRLPRAFTLIELLVVIGIIVLLIALAVPALSLISGSNSINGAENNISAMLGRVRGDAIGIQQDMGVLFFIDPASGNVTMAQVQKVGNVGGITMLDLVPDREFMALPKGVSAQIIDNAVLSGGSAGTRSDDGYIGYNVADDDGTPRDTITPTDLFGVRFGGVILFDAYGKLVSRPYGFAGTRAGATSTIFNLLYTGSVVPDTTKNVTIPGGDFVPANNQPAADSPMQSGYGLVLFDREGFENNGDLDDPQASNLNYDVQERGEETWIDENGTPLMVNRYNGTLVRGE